MKRFYLHGLVMLLTFAFGFGVERLIQYRPGNEVAPVSQLPPDNLNIIPFPTTSVMPIATIAAEPSAPPTATLILDYDRKKIIRYGIFYIYGRTPREFADFHSIELDLIGAERPYNGYISINTVLAVDRYDRAMSTFALVTERRLFFVTSPTRESEVEYRFDGEFLTKDLDSMQGENKAALRGTLTKTKNGRTIAERVVSFRVEHMGC
jgi:hypothetical protein